MVCNLLLLTLPPSKSGCDVWDQSGQLALSSPSLLPHRMSLSSTKCTLDLFSAFRGHAPVTLFHVGSGPKQNASSSISTPIDVINFTVGLVIGVLRCV